MPYRILIVNPNSNTSMTESLHAPIDSLNYNDTHYTYFTADSRSPTSINNLADAAASATACLDTLIHVDNAHNLNHHDAVLIACFSPHPLIPLIRDWGPAFPKMGIEPLLSCLKPNFPPTPKKPLPSHQLIFLSIFEASVSVALQLLAGSGKRFGIVSTGEQWEGILTEAIHAEAGSSGAAAALGREMAGRVFAGVECVGMSAGELHPADDDRADGSADGAGGVKHKVMAATGRLLERGDIGVVVLGCAGMAGMEDWVREEVDRRGIRDVKVVDGVKAGVGVLQGMMRGDFNGWRRTVEMRKERVMSMEVQPRLAEYERQLSLLEEQNKIRVKRARGEV